MAKIKIPASVNAEISGATVGTVKQVRKGARGTGKVAKRVKVVDEMFELGAGKLIEEIKRVVNI